jgi:CheY-like chemotaxis protein
MGNILVVDDDMGISAALCTLLRREGHRVVVASDGREALARLHAGERPGIILLDLAMPTMNGAEFRAAQLRDPDLADIPVVVLSADRRVHEKATALGAAAAFGKPFEVTLLLETIARMTDQPPCALQA